MIRVQLIEDSRAVIAYVGGLLRNEVDIELLAPAMDGRSGVDAVVARRPNVVLMDLDLPILGGVAAITEIMQSAPCPIVVLSSLLDSPDRDRTFESLQAGAVDAIAKPRGLEPDTVEAFRQRLVKTIRLMAQARVVRRIALPGSMVSPAPVPAGTQLKLPDTQIVLIGCSTGGPPILYDLLKGITAPYPLPIIIAQHIIPGFEEGLANWLRETGHVVKVTRGGELPLPGEVYVARADRNLVFEGRQLRLIDPTPNAIAPSIDALFSTAAPVFGPRATAFLLTGMGVDGAKGLFALNQAGAYTVTQTGSTCVVDGMPAAARALGAHRADLTPAQMIATLKLQFA